MASVVFQDIRESRALWHILLIVKHQYSCEEKTKLCRHFFMSAHKRISLMMQWGLSNLLDNMPVLEKSWD